MTVETAIQAFQKLEPIVSRLVLDEQNVPAEGLEFVEAKTETLLSYLTNLSYYMVLKATPGAAIPTGLFEQLFKQRWLLQRARPLDQRMHYSIEKILKEMQSPDAARASTPGTLRKNVTDADGDDAEAPVEEEQAVYKAPRFQAVEAPTKTTKNDKLEKLVERKRMRFEQGELMRELREEFVDAPLEIGGSGHDAKGSMELETLERKAAHKKRFEEENFVRMMATKKDKKETKRLRELKMKSQSAGVASLADISDISNLLQEDKRLVELKDARGRLKRQREAQDEPVFGGGNRQKKRQNKGKKK
eukprot:GEMP01062955.1.p1 GENE.GEMP01062955.1~~GEMP01062955.1.p1  ORF type:complete len:304 (+),score=90.59 GEMP01062955.1:23-934(+)